MTRSLELQVPASIGNMGSGFDALSVAVRLYLRLRVRVHADGDGTRTWDFGDLRLDGENLIERAFRTIAARHAAVVPSMTIEVRSDIPLRAGLGSSAAATVGGLRLYEAVTAPLAAGELLTVATEIEGHPDNAAAALLGGLVGSCERDDGSVTALTSRWPESIRFVILTPEVQLSTASARTVLPDRISRADAVYNLQRVVLVLQALDTGRRDLLREALRDRWHQPYRQPLVPGLEAALALDHPDLLGICLSGSGPSIVALAEHDVPAVEALLATSYEPLGIPFQIRTLGVHQEAREQGPGAGVQDPHTARMADPRSPVAVPRSPTPDPRSPIPDP